jgi:hypothetical protein
MSDRSTLDFKSSPPVLRCWGCGATQPVVLPMKLSEVGAALDKFKSDHKHCEAP